MNLRNPIRISTNVPGEVDAPLDQGIPNEVAPGVPEASIALRSPYRPETGRADSVRNWILGVWRGWQAVHDRVSLVQLPLTPLVATASKHSSSGDPNLHIRVIPIRGGGSEVQYGILSLTGSRVSFRLPLGRRPRFSTRISILDRDSQMPGVTEFSVGVEVDGVGREVSVRALRNHGFERRRSMSVDLSEYAGREVTLILKTRSSERERNAALPAVWDNPRMLSRRPLRAQVTQLRKDLRKLGFRGVGETLVSALRGKLTVNNSHGLYQLWIEKNALGPEDVDRIRENIDRFEQQPLVSIVTPVYNTDPQWLEKCIESVRNQLYPNWELCIVDDASTRPEVGRILEKYAALDERIRVARLATNQGIALASNEALSLTEGDYVGLLDHDDELTPDALYEVVSLLLEHPEADVIYSDEDKVDTDGTRSEPFFKPDWSPEHLLSCMYTCHFTVYRKALLDRVHGFRPGFDGSQDYDLMLRVTELTDNVLHVPRILYHWRRAPGSAAESRSAKPLAYDAGKRALRDRISRGGNGASLSDGKLYGIYRVRHQVDASTSVTIVIPTRDNVDLLRTCIQSIEDRTSHQNYEILVVDNNSTDPRTEEYLASLPHPVVRYSDTFNFSRLNNFAASRAAGDYLVFLNNDTEAISPDWLTSMLEFGQQPGIGIVGAKLLFPDGRIQHAGITLGLGGVAGHVLTGFPGGSPHYFGVGSIVRNCSAVTAACMMISRGVFDSVDGFDEQLPLAYNDVDLCLRVRERGLRIVWTPYAELYHHESASRTRAIDPREVDFMRSRWGTKLLRDPYYNPNLTLEHSDFRLRL